jgi:hypothetical protein
MTQKNHKLLLVGDNPFHNISHLSQERARERIEDPAHSEDPGNPKFASYLIMKAMENGANGFTFSVSETTLAILQELEKHNVVDRLGLYPVVPYAFEYVRLATQLGGIPGLAKKFGLDMVKSGNIRGLGFGLKGALTADPLAMLKTYLAYETDRVKDSVKTKIHIDSILLHQLITDMALALNLDWIFKSYIDYLQSKKITPGFNTGNFAYLVNKFNEWDIDLRRVLILAPFNKVGFQVTPSIAECERALGLLKEPNVIAMSILAAGYLKPQEAIDYIASLPNIRGIAVGVSKERHAKEAFQLFNQTLNSNTKQIN